MTTELATTNKPLWNEDDIKLIREMCAPKAVTDSEFKVFLYIAGKYGLDPLTKEIYIQKFYNKGRNEWNPATIFVSYNGMVKTADRTGLLDGIQPECIYNAKGELTGARSTVWKKGCSHPFVAEVDFEEYAAPERNPMWKAASAGGKPKTMIKKVANVHALRMAFSLSDVYIEEEFDKAVEEPRTPPAKQLPAQPGVDTVTGEVTERVIDWKNLENGYSAATTMSAIEAIDTGLKALKLPDSPEKRALWKHREACAARIQQVTAAERAGK